MFKDWRAALGMVSVEVTDLSHESDGKQNLNQGVIQFNKIKVSNVGFR